jgi:hypothetical protein
MIGDCPVGVLSFLVHCDAVNFDVCQNRGVAKKAAILTRYPRRKAIRAYEPTPALSSKRLGEIRLASMPAYFFRQLMRMLGCTRALMLSASHSRAARPGPCRDSW